MKRLRVLVVEDEPSTRTELAGQLAEHSSVGDVVCADGGDEAVRLLGSGIFDAAFLDIAMPGLNGMDVARILTRLSDPPAIVFVTAYDNHAVEAFGLGAVDYLLKPFRAERLAEAVARIDHHRSGPASAGEKADDLAVVQVELAGRTIFIRRDDIAFAEAHGDYVRLHSGEDSHLLRQSLTYLEQVWDEAGFVRAHRSYLVNLAAVTELRVTSTAGLVAVTGAGEVPVSRRHSRLLRERLLQAARNKDRSRP
ncbi:LytTR family DNA-binding domain-containing protein [Glycomyces sp. L485]|uniref:LytR/AlgR family response regulator transcription factor n=1 Tax=Glycomyces sp. L485 TaxID=2909235 RepID=UPI001F4AD455|nr:LytTR family DNA-binding domain-containing protein [Glycomyces sp. L485]MCH7230999.1 LytTR family DNA-binding domain-containing protein [Glycomyces sp. L485]